MYTHPLRMEQWTHVSVFATVSNVSVRITIGGLAFCKTAPPTPQEQNPKHCCPRQIPVPQQHRLATRRPLPETYLQNHPPTRPPCTSLNLLQNMGVVMNL